MQQVGKKAEAEEFEANAPNRSNGQKVFSWLGDAILSTPGVILVLLLAAGLLGGGVYGTTQLQQATNMAIHCFISFILTFMLMSNVVQEFDPIWFLPPTSYLRQWFEASDTFFPSDGER